MTSKAKAEEKQKSGSQKAEDIAYTVNHAIACTVTDVLSPFIGNYTQRYLGRRIEIGCGHDHSAPTPPASLPPEEAQSAVSRLSGKGLGKGMFTGLLGSDIASEGAYKRLKPAFAPAVPQSNLKHWWVGELAGDFGAVPVTVLMQRMFPGVMHAIRVVAEPIAKPLFRAGAERSTRIWAEENQIARNSDAYTAHKQEILDREMSHLPQAFVWTASSAALNLAAQRLSGNKGDLSHLIAGKLAGSATSSALVVGFRGLAPHQAYTIDRLTSRHVFEPLAQSINGTKGNDSWQDRVVADRQNVSRLP